jgi:tyrosine-protein phosphatase SIW14
MFQATHGSRARVALFMNRSRALAIVGTGATLALPWLVLATPPTSPTTRPIAERLTGLAGIENVARIAPGVYRGNQPTLEGLRTLKSLGVRTVVNLRHYHGKAEADGCREVGLDYLRIPLASTEEPSDADTRRFLAIVTDASRQPVYFHCWRGKDRTGTMCAVYRVAVQHWSAEDALAEMDAFGTFKGYRDLRRYVRNIAAAPTRVWPLPVVP